MAAPAVRTLVWSGPGTDSAPRLDDEPPTSGRRFHPRVLERVASNSSALPHCLQEQNPIKTPDSGVSAQ